MANLNAYLRSFRVRVPLVIVSVILIMVVIDNILDQRSAFDSQHRYLRDKLESVAATSALLIDPEAVKSIPLDKSGVNSSGYKKVMESFRKIEASNPQIADVYILVKTPQKNQLLFVADGEDPTRVWKEGNAMPGDSYDASAFPAMIEGFERASSDKNIGEDEWGKEISGYAPVFDKDGHSIAVLGEDMMAEDVYRMQKVLLKNNLIMFAVGIVLALFLGTLFAGSITRPIGKLIEGTRRISRGELDYKVVVKGKNELSDFAYFFNKMADDLGCSQRLNREYFYKVIQTLVRVVEAKDPYTRGHSERVASYAASIAKQMGLSPEMVEQVHQAGLLHDIGKMAIGDMVLHKPGKLTTEEWQIVQAHPAVGEDILKPVLFNKEMLEIVRGHHERLDGSGYPDHLKGQEIPLIVQIMAVADTYDAMTSLRPYRDPMKKELAIQELLKYKGIHYDPAVVDAFMVVLGNNTSSL